FARDALEIPVLHSLLKPTSFAWSLCPHRYKEDTLILHTPQPNLFGGNGSVPVSVSQNRYGVDIIVVETAGVSTYG
ncbi:MAG: hypothetical protein D6800_06445, partial [Candidatus Zixiibacteriota bacterium]